MYLCGADEMSHQEIFWVTLVENKTNDSEVYYVVLQPTKKI